MLKTLTSILTGQKQNSSSASASSTLVIPRDQHNMSRKQVSRAALNVLYGLHEAGYKAFLVGGCLRDLHLGRHPKDFDVATDASPEQVAKLFDRSRIIGRRFRIVHVRFGREVIEVTTFRGGSVDHDANNDKRKESQTGLLLRDNIFGSIEEDAERRDFTVNALYYNIADFSLYDFTGSVTDLNAGVIRTIGDPTTRYREDPVRMLRAARFAAKLNFKIDPATETPIFEMGLALQQISPARLFDEQLKLMLGGYSEACFHELVRLNLFTYLFPDSDWILKNDQDNKWQAFFIAALRNTDDRLAQNKGVTPAFLIAVILWPVVMQEDGDIQQRMSRVLNRQCRTLSIPRRFTEKVRDMWWLQGRLEKRQKPGRTLTHPAFRAAYDFLLLREQAGLLPNSTLGQWWTDFQNANPDQQPIPRKSPPRSDKRRRRRRRPPGSSRSSS